MRSRAFRRGAAWALCIFSAGVALFAVGDFSAEKPKLVVPVPTTITMERGSGEIPH